MGLVGLGGDHYYLWQENNRRKRREDRCRINPTCPIQFILGHPPKKDKTDKKIIIDFDTTTGAILDPKVCRRDFSTDVYFQHSLIRRSHHMGLFCVHLAIFGQEFSEDQV